MRKNLVVYFISLVFSILGVLSAQNMNAEKVIDNAFNSYKAQLENIDDIKKVTDKGVHYQKWVEEEGEVVYKYRREQEMMGNKSISVYDGQYLYSKNSGTDNVTKEKRNLSSLGLYQALKDNIDRINYLGTEELDGHKTHIIMIEDITRLKKHDSFLSQIEGWEIQEGSAKIWIGENDWVLKKIKSDVKGVDQSGKERNVKATMKYEDYKNKKGMLIPYRKVYIMGMASKSLSPEEKRKREEALKEMEKMKEKLDEMPKQQRKMLKEKMKNMEKYQKALGKGEMEFSTEVKEVKINSGLADELFNGDNL